MSATQVESVEWINEVLGGMWPFIDQAAAKIAKEVIEPIVQQTVPAAFRGIHFQRFTLGPAPLRVAAIQALHPAAGTLSLLVDVVYRGDPDICLAIHGACFGVKQLELQGRLCLTFSPMVGMMPVIAAVRASFANIPSWDFVLSGAAAAADLPRFAYKALKDVVSDVLAGMLVLPNAMVFKLATDHVPGIGDFFALAYTPPRLLQLTISQASNLKNTDNEGFKMFVNDRSDPYVVVRLGAQTIRTRTIRNDLNPVWDETHLFLIHSDAQAVDFAVWDEDPVGGDDDLGSARLTVADLIREEEVTVDIGNGSRLQVRSHIFTLISDAGRLEATAAGGTRAVLTVLVDQAFDLPLHGQRSAVVRVAVGGAGRTSRAANLFRQEQRPVPGPIPSSVTEEVPERNPEWEQALEVPLSDLDSTLLIEVMAGDETIGSASISLSDVIAADQLAVRRLFPLSNGGGIFLTVRLYALQPTDRATLLISPAGTDPETDGATELWLSKLLEALWSFSEQAINRMVIDSILPEVQSHVPLAISCTKFSLGTKLPVIHNIHTHFEDGAIRVDFDMCYDGDCDVRFGVMGMSFGVQKVALSGRLSVVLRPLLPELPIVGAVQAYFTNLPVLRLDFSGLADLLDWPMVSRAFRKVVKSQLQQQLVLPNRFKLHLAADTPATNIFWQLYVPPKGVLRVFVVEARGLKNTDAGIFSYFNMDRSDPFCIVSLGSETHVTPTVNNSLDPVWPVQAFDFIVCSTEQLLNLEVYDEDTTNADDLLGQAQVSCQDLAERRDIWLPLTEGTGQLHLAAEYLSLSADREALAAIPPGSDSAAVLLTVLVDQATDLAVDGQTTACVEVTVGGSAKRTPEVPLTRTLTRNEHQVVEAIRNPHWEAPLLFLLPRAVGLTAQCRVVAAGEALGGFAVDLQHILTACQVEHGALVLRQQFALSDAAGSDSTLAATFMLASLHKP